MSDLINRTALISKCKAEIEICDKRIERRKGLNYFDQTAKIEHINCKASEYEKAIELLETAPTIDAVPVVHARWENVDKENIRCSNCRETWWIPKWKAVCKGATFCRDCGAKMDTEEQLSQGGKDDGMD